MAIYYLDVDDEITSAAARLRDSSDTRIALVVQSGSRVATSRINFKLLAREARHYNRHLAIVAADASVRSLAQTAGLAVYGSVGEYQKAESGGLPGSQPGGADATGAGLDAPPVAVSAGGAGLEARSVASSGGNSRSGRPADDRPRKPKPVRGGLGLRRMLAAALIAVIVIGAVSAYLLLPSATIVLTLRAESLGPIDLAVRVDPTVTAANDTTATVPGVPKEFPMQVSGTFKATGQNVVDTAATGTVTFISGNTGNAVLVPAGTQVTTAGGLVFATNAAVTVPKATLSGLTITPRTADVAVTAVKTGPAGNVAAGAIVNVPAWLATALVVGNQVTNKQATSGGAHTVTPFVQQADIDAAEASLSTQLGTQLQTQASDPNSVAAGFEIFPRTAALGTPSYDPDPASVLNQAVESFNLSASGSGTATTANLAGVRSLAQRKIEGMVQAGHSVVDGSVQVALGSPTSLGAAVSIPVKAQAMQAPAVDVAQLRNAVKGKSVEEAKAFLSQYGEAQVSVSSFWSSTVSGFDFRIDITVIAPSAAPIATPTQRPVSTPRATGQPSGPEPIPSASLSASPGMTPEATSGTTPAITPDVTPEITPAPTDSPVAAPTEAPVDTSPPTAGASPTAT